MSSRDGIAVSGFGSNQLLVFEMAHEASPKKTKFLVVSRYRTIAPGYVDLNLGGAKLEELKSLGVHLDSNWAFETHLREVVLKAARRVGVVLGAEKLFKCPRVLMSPFKAYILPP